MKNLLRISLLTVLAFIVSLNYSCGNDDKIIDDVFDSITRGAVLRTVNEPEDNPALVVGVGNTFTIEVEEQDIENGGLLDFVDVYVRFIDNTVLSEDAVGGPGTDQTFPVENPDAFIPDDVFLRTITAAEFTPGPFDLPRTTINITESDLAAVLPTEHFDSGDEVEVRLALNLTDGRVFTRGDTAGTVSGDGFYNSPYWYTINIDSGVDINYLEENRNTYVVVAGFDNTYRVLAEITDQVGGDNIAGLDIYRRFVDNTPENGDSSFAESLVASFESEDFGDSENGYPTAEVIVTEAELLDELESDDVSVDDAFFIRYAVTTVDGRTVTNEIEATNFYDMVIATDCPFPALDETDSFTGDYVMEQVSPSIFGYETFGDGNVTTLFAVQTDASQEEPGVALENNQRAFDAEYLFALGFGNPDTYVIEFNICDVTVSEGLGPIDGSTGVWCGNVAGIILGPHTGAGTYDATNDSEFTLGFTDDVEGECGDPLVASVKFTRVD